MRIYRARNLVGAQKLLTPLFVHPVLLYYFLQSTFAIQLSTCLLWKKYCLSFVGLVILSRIFNICRDGHTFLIVCLSRVWNKNAKKISEYVQNVTMPCCQTSLFTPNPHWYHPLQQVSLLLTLVITRSSFTLSPLLTLPPLLLFCGSRSSRHLLARPPKSYMGFGKNKGFSLDTQTSYMGLKVVSAPTPTTTTTTTTGITLWLVGLQPQVKMGLIGLFEFELDMLKQQKGFKLDWETPPSKNLFFGRLPCECHMSQGNNFACTLTPTPRTGGRG